MSTQEEEYKPQGRSVLDFDSEDDLYLALRNMNLHSREDCAELRDAAPPCDAGAIVMEDGAPEQLEEAWDWTLTNYDVEHSEPQTIAKEVKRLQALKSYQMIGAEREEAFDRICRMGARIFDAPTTFVVLLDIGRQWFASEHGLGSDASRETPRDVGFCKHTILYKEDVLVIPDCSKDFRFHDNIFVAGEPHLRFYAGAALLSPEGYKLGTFCFVDVKPRPDGLSEDEKATLKDLAAMAMKAMVDRRELKEKVSREVSQVVASAAHDLMTPLEGMQLSLQTLQEDETLRSHLGDRHKQCLSTSMATAQMMQQICTTTLDMLEQAEDNDKTRTTKAKSKAKNKEKDSDDRGEEDYMDAPLSIVRSIVNVNECIKRVHSIIDPIPKDVPLIITVEPDVPLAIISNDQMILRACLNLLSNACSRTIYGKIQLRVFQREGYLIFECEDSRDSFPEPQQDAEEQQENQIKLCQETTTSSCHDDPNNSKKPVSLEEELTPLALSSLAAQVKTLGGKYGHRGLSSSQGGKTGVYFWFSVPIEEASPSMLPLPTVVSPASSCTDSPVHPEKDLLSSSIYPIAEMKEPPLMMPSASSPRNDVTKHYNHGGPYVAAAMSPAPRRVSTQETTEKSNNHHQKGVRKKRALVIEDSNVVRNSIARALTKEGYEVFQATDGVEGLRELQTRIHDITFCDFFMPNLNGIECVQAYREWEQEHRPHFCQYIVGISNTNAKEDDVSKALQVGMNEYKPKPMTTKILSDLCNGLAVQALSAYLDSVPFRTNSFVFSGTEEEPAMKAITTQISNRRRPRDEMGLEAVTGFFPPQLPAPLGGAGLEIRSRKRLKMSDLVAIPPDFCLIATARPSSDMDSFAQKMESLGWRVFIDNDWGNVLEALKLRRWGATLIFEDFLVGSQEGCVTQFREWEKQQQKIRQDNLYLVRNCALGSNNRAHHTTATLPSGFDGELDPNLLWEHLMGKLASQKTDHLVQGGGSWNAVPG